MRATPAAFALAKMTRLSAVSFSATLLALILLAPALSAATNPSPASSSPSLRAGQPDSASLASVAGVANGLQDDAAERPDVGALAALLDARCASCHAPGADEPKALKKWAAARDLVATAADPELVVPGDPDESELFLSVDFDDMPPPESDIEPLTDDEKALIAAWIRAGATVPEAQRPVDGEAAPAKAGARTTAVGVWIARWHPLVVHFPIGLLVAAFVAELLRRARPAWRTGDAATFCFALGALATVPAAGLGWWLAEHTAHDAEALDLHRWLGVGLAVASIVAWAIAAKKPNARLALLALLAALVTAAGHTGGVLTYGADWLALPF